MESFLILFIIRICCVGKVKTVVLDILKEANVISVKFTVVFLPVCIVYVGRIIVGWWYLSKVARSKNFDNFDGFCICSPAKSLAEIRLEDRVMTCIFDCFKILIVGHYDSYYLSVGKVGNVIVLWTVCGNLCKNKVLYTCNTVYLCHKGLHIINASENVRVIWWYYNIDVTRGIACKFKSGESSYENIYLRRFTLGCLLWWEYIEWLCTPSYLKAFWVKVLHVKHVEVAASVVCWQITNLFVS